MTRICILQNSWTQNDDNALLSGRSLLLLALLSSTYKVSLHLKDLRASASQEPRSQARCFVAMQRWGAQRIRRRWGCDRYLIQSLIYSRKWHFLRGLRHYRNIPSPIGGKKGAFLGIELQMKRSFLKSLNQLRHHWDCFWRITYFDILFVTFTVLHTAFSGK